MADKQQSQSDDDKTEEPSAQRLEDFRKEGQVAQSKELTSFFVLLATLITIYAAGPDLITEFMGTMRKFFVESGTTTLTQDSAGSILKLCLSAAASLILPVAFAGFVAGVVGSIIQIGFNFTWAPIEPQVDRMNPLQGLQKIVSVASLVEGLKSVLKLVAVVSITYYMIKDEIAGSATVSEMEGFQLASYMGTTGFRMVMGVCVALFVVAALDFAYQKFRYQKSLMMTKQEVKQEHKQREGDPLLKARMKSIAREMARKRMMQEVPKADVIVTNPTHIAVALRYDAEKMAAPRVIAKGSDLVAQRIKEIARKNGIPLVENVPLQIFKAGSVYFTALGKANENLPKPQLTAIAAALGRPIQP